MGASNIKHIPLQDELPSLIEKLRTPAGDDPLFADLASLSVNSDIFKEKCHATWKELHEKSLDEIMTMERLLSSTTRNAMPTPMIFYFNRCIQIWRRINDSILWLLLGFQDHVIRTICHRKDRPRLASANPECIRPFLESLNSDPGTIAIWCDATTCADIGDVYCKAPRGRPSGFFEVKEGSMNERILELLQSQGSTEQVVRKIDDFAHQNGLKAVKQLERVIRQKLTSKQVADIIRNDKGYDPYRQAEIRISDTETPVETYDLELQALIDEGMGQESPLLRCLDRCIWVYVDVDRDKSEAKKIEAFRKAFFAASPKALQWMEETFRSAASFMPVRLEDNINIPDAIPIFLRQLKSDTIADLLLGKLMHSVFIYVDWAEVAAILREQGAELTWSSFKSARRQQALPREQRLLMIGGRIPGIRLLNNATHIDGFSKIARIYYDGVKASSIAAQYVEVLQSSARLTSFS